MLDRRKFLLGTCGSLASLMGLNGDLSFAQAERPPWIHEGTLDLSKFVVKDNRVFLYTFGEEDHVCACWEMPSCKLVEKFKAPISREGSVLEITNFVPEFPPSPYRTTAAGTFAEPVFEAEDATLYLLQFEQRRWYKLGSPGWVAGMQTFGWLAPDRIAYRVADEENRGRFVIQTAVLKEGRVIPDKRCYVPLQISFPIYWDYRGDNLRLLYASFSEKSFHNAKLDLKLQDKQLDDLALHEYRLLLERVLCDKLSLAVFDLRANKLVESRTVYPTREVERNLFDKQGEFSVSPVAYNPREKKLYVLTSHNYLVLAEESLTLESAVPLRIVISLDEKKVAPPNSVMSVVDMAGQYLAVAARVFGPVCVVSLPKRALVLEDGTHWARILRTFEDVDFPLAVIRTEIHDMIFIPQTSLLAVITGTGDLYLYNVEKGRLERRVVLAQSFLK
jgi:hypothetical protein